MNSDRIPKARSVGGAVLLTLVCVNTLLLALFGVVDYLGEKRRLDEALHKELSVLAEQLAVNLDAPLWYMERESAERVVEGVMQNEHVAAVLVTDRETGRISLAFTRDKAWRIASTEGHPALDGVISQQRDIAFGDKPVGSLQIFLTERFAARELSTALGRIVLRILCLNVALVTILAVVLRRQVIRPLTRLENYAARISTGGEALSLAGCGYLPGELRSLGLAMEEMVDRLRSAQRKYQDIYENATEGVLQTSLDGRILSANAAMARMLGYASPEALVQEVESLDGQVYHDPQDRQALIDRLLAENSVAGYQVRFVRRDHQLLWVLINVRLVRDEAGEPLSVEGTVTDVTARVRAERRLEVLNHHLREAVKERTERLAVKAAQLEAANERLQELDRLKSGFLSTVSHDQSAGIRPFPEFRGRVHGAPPVLP